MRFFGWLAALAVVAIALVAAAVGYNVGLNVSVAASGAPVYPMYGWGFGFFPFFGFFFFLILLFVIFSVIRRVAWSAGGRHGYGMGHGPGHSGPGGWWRYGAGDEFERWHRRAHGEPEEPTAQTDPAKRE